MEQATSETPLRAAIRIVGLSTMAKRLGVTYQAVRKWEAAGRMPRTEWTGETRYSQAIEELTQGEVRRVALLGSWAPHAPDRQRQVQTRADEHAA